MPISARSNASRACAAQANESIFSEYNARNGESLTKLVNEQGVQLRKFNDDIYDSFGEAAAEVYEETRDHSALAKKIDDSFKATMRDVGAWQSIAEVAFSAQRNRVLGIGG